MPLMSMTCNLADPPRTCHLGKHNEAGQSTDMCPGTRWGADLCHDVVGGGVIGDEAGQDDGGRVLQAGQGLLHCPHQGLQVRVLLQAIHARLQ